MKEVSKTGHFTIDLPSSDAATALSGPGNSFLKKFESLTGVSLTIRGLQLEMNGIISIRPVSNPLRIKSVITCALS